MTGSIGAGQIAGSLPLLLVLLARGGYAAGVLRLGRRGVRWPRTRTGWFSAGLLVVLVGTADPLSGHGSSAQFPQQSLSHLLVMMLAPTALALGAPGTLWLRACRPTVRRATLRLLHARPARWVALGPVIVLLDVAGLYAYYLTSLFAVAEQHPPLHLLVHAHMFLAGCLVSWFVVGRDPGPRQGGLAAQLAVLLATAAAHDVLPSGGRRAVGFGYRFPDSSRSGPPTRRRRADGTGMEQVTAAQDHAPGGPAGARTAESRAPRPPRGRARRFPGQLVLLVVVGIVAVVLRAHSASALWLDEALSVNIASLPAREVFGALEVDGSPPLYYLLLHFWIDLVGSGDAQVRLLSALFGIAALPVAYLLGLRVGGRRAAALVVALLAVDPFLVRYSTEARMYSLVVLLTLLVLLAALRARELPTPGRLTGLAVAAGLLSLAHYWALFFLAALWLGLAVLSIRGNDTRRYRRLLVGLSCGGVLFLPWLPSFLFQVRHTGTPWADPPGPTVLVSTVREWAGGSQWPATTLAVVLVALMVLALRPGRAAADGAAADGPAADGARRGTGGRHPWLPTMPVRGLLGCSIGALLLGLAASRLLGAGYAVRYSSAMIGPALLLAAVGATRLGRVPRAAAAVLVCVLGLVSAVPLTTSTLRTQARQTAAVISAAAQPGDLVLYCPDQLGPAVSRLLPASVTQLSYPTLGAPQRVDWVDYAQRNTAAHPQAIAREVSTRAARRIFLVTSPHYLTFGTQCEEVAATLASLRGGGSVLVQRNTGYYENESVTAFPVRSPA